MYNLHEFFVKLVYMTDRDANIVATSTLQPLIRLSCTAHVLNTVQQTTLGKIAVFGEEVSPLTLLVTCLKQTNLQNHLK